MPSRAEDWLRQASRDLQLTREALAGGIFEWAAFAAQQAAEKAVKALYQGLDKHYIAPRYPNSYPEGAPMDFYTRAEAERAIDGAERVIEHCKSHLFR